MPHLVTAAAKGDSMYYIFSTIVMEAVTEIMTEDEMVVYLALNNYPAWLDPKGVEADRMYWNGRFWYVTEEDGYYV